MLEPSRWNSDVDREHMQVFRAKRLAAIGALALSLALGAGSAVVVATVDSAFAQESDTDLDGVVEAMPADGMVGTWQIGGKIVQVTETTRIDQEMGQLAVGVSVGVAVGVGVSVAVGVGVKVGVAVASAAGTSNGGIAEAGKKVNPSSSLRITQPVSVAT